jgi:coenzyme F420-reducing hydrogenase gamma subunit
MSHYHKERDAFIEHQNRCTRNMPIEADDPIASSETLRRWWDKAHDEGDETVTWPTEERINNIGQNGPTGEHYMNKYQRKLTSPIIKEVDWKVEVIIDVYDVLDAYPSGCPPIDHAIKKLLCTGSRGAKDWETDLQEAIDSLERAKSFPPIPF